MSSNKNILRAQPRLQMFSEEQITKIHSATLKVLEKTGVRVLHEEARELLLSAGARAGKEDIVRIPPDLVEQALKSAPAKVVLAGRKNAPDIALEGWNNYFGTGSDCPNIIDPHTGQRRRFTEEDTINAIRLCDTLTNIDFVMSVGLISEIAEREAYRRQFELMLEYTGKPIVFTACDRSDTAEIYEMCISTSGSPDAFRSRPISALYAEPISPLTHGDSALDKLLFAAEKGIPTVYTPGIMAGGTGPVTIAGTIVTGNAELLSGLVISQLKSKESPFIYGGVFTSMDMSSCVFLYASPEFYLLNMALAELAHHYRLPVFGTAGCSDSKLFDEQAAAESAMSCLVAALCGANLIHDVGYIESGLTSSFEMIVLTDEIASFVRHIVRGIGMDDESFALAEIENVGPGGHFLTQEHTLSHFRTELWFPNLLDRNRFDIWASKGKQSLRDRLKTRVKEILNMPM